MKTKQTFMIAMVAAVALFGAGRAFAQSAADKTYLQNNIRVESITKAVPGGGQPDLPLSQGTTPQIYFDVKLVDTNGTPAERWTITGNSYSANGTKRPYLVLNIPLKGDSSKEGVDLLSGEAATESTTTAAAYYMGAGDSPDTLRFVYNVRPGDIVEAISWTDNNGIVRVGGEISEITITSQTGSGLPAASGVGMSQNCLQAAAGAAIPGDGMDWPVSGYTLTIGEQGNRNYGKLYHGLVPFTVTTPSNALPVGFTNSAFVNQCYVWAESVGDDGSKKYWNVIVTPMASGNEVIAEADPTEQELTAFSEAGFFTGPSASADASGTFATQRFYLDVSEAIPAGTKLRVCYGVRDDGTVAALPTDVFAYVEATVEATPLTSAQAEYEVLSADMVDGTFELKSDIAANVKDANGNALKAGDEVVGGTIIAAAGEDVTIFIRKNAIDTLLSAGKLYASIQQISSANAARVTWEHYDVEMDPAAREDYGITFSIPANATGGITEYRIHVPGLKDGNGADTPFYLQIESTPKRETINLVPAEGNGGIATEFLQTGTNQEGETSFLQYTLTVPVDNTKKRTFLIFPITDRGYDIGADSTIVVGNEEKNALEAIAKYVVLQNQNVSLGATSTPTLKVSVERGQTSATFYVAAVNDYTKDRVLTGATIKLNASSVLGSGQEDTMGDIIFSAASCNANGVITGKNDECEIKVTPFVQNRAPAIITSNPPASGALNSNLRFNFTANDVATDYLVAQMNFGDGETQTLLYANDDVMKELLGENGWEQELASIADRYGVNVANLRTGGENRRDRNGKTTQSQISFEHVYASGSNPSWTLTVYDSSSASVTVTGTLTLSAEQMFQFYTWSKATGGLGYVLWGTQSPGNAEHMAAWSFGPTYTFNTMAKNGGNTLVTVQAVPLAAGATNPGYTEAEVSNRYDSFFYKWSATSDYAELLPTGEDPNQNVYSRVISFGRDFVKGGGGGTGGSSEWSDIVLSAVFIREYLGGDYDDARARVSRADWPTYTTDEPYLFDLGDYNTDGIPDGWVLKTFGETEGRTLLEGASMVGQGAASITSSTAEGEDGATTTVTIADQFPALGWAGADSAYRTSNRIGPPGGSFKLEGTLFDYKTRLRGRDEALNAADGQGNWISHPQWLVAIHEERVLNGQPYAVAGTLREQDNNPPTWSENWRQIKLATSKYTLSRELTSAQMSSTENGVPYVNNDVITLTIDNVSTQWAVVIDENGYPIRKGTVDRNGAALYPASTVRVCITENSADYERLRYDYPAWCYYHLDAQGNEIGYEVADGVTHPGDNATLSQEILYPFASAAESAAAQTLTDASAAASVDAFTGASTIPGLLGATGFTKYCYVDARVPHGILVDEPFYNARKGDYIDPRMTNWLDRATTSVDQDGDGLPNALEYFFWYYASRIAYAPVFRHDGNTDIQIATPAWPAIDLRWRTSMNSDGLYGTSGLFAMGRCYRNSFDPFLDFQGRGDFPGNNPYTNAGQASHCRGNFWDPIPIESVMAFFHPLVKNEAADPDNDGLAVMEEVSIGTNPIDCDSDNDFLPDGWEVAMGTDPIVADGDANPDGDYFACVDVELYPTYHHVYGINYAISGDAGNETVVKVQYDREGKTVSWEEIVDGVKVTRTADYDVTRVRATADPTVTYARRAGKVVMLRDHEVYEAFGFDPMTGWWAGTTKGLGVASAAGANGKFDNFTPRNTKAFTNKEEFFSGVARSRAWERASLSVSQVAADSTSPTSADTNGDGLPDGWTAYVGGFAPAGTPPDGAIEHGSSPSADYDQDGLSAVREFACRAVNLLIDGEDMHASMAGLRSDTYDTWVNKLYPTDPWNPDTDFDGLWDGTEGGSQLIYGTPSDFTWLGGGCNPTSMDTDGDGMSDAWEFRWFKGVTTTTETSGEGEDATTTSTVTRNASPDPTNNNDADLDYDRDGLPNYQEYLTGFLRHTRYDLGPEAARIYNAKPGKRTWNEAMGRFEWKTVADLPDLYSASRDLANIGRVRSSVYLCEKVYGDEADAESAGGGGNYHVHALAEAMGRNSLETKPTTTASLILNFLDPAITRALSAQWGRTVLLPSRGDMLALGEGEAHEVAVLNAATEYESAISAYTSYLLNLDPQAFGAGTTLLPTIARERGVTDEIATRFAAVKTTGQALADLLGKVCSTSEDSPLYDESYADFVAGLTALGGETLTDGRTAGLGTVTFERGLVTLSMNTWSAVRLIALDGTMAATSAESRFSALVYGSADGLLELATQLDAAFLRLQTDDSRQTANYASTNVPTIMALIDAIEEKLAALRAGATAGAYPGFSGWVAEWVNGGMKDLWEARRDQILAYLVREGRMDADSVDYRRELLAETGGQVDIAFVAPSNAQAEAAARKPDVFAKYEETARDPAMPFFVGEAYRQAIRGFNGGLWAQPIRADAYVGALRDEATHTPASDSLRLLADDWVGTYMPALGPVGYHRPFLPFGAANAGGDGYAELSEAARAGRKALSAQDETVPLFGLAMNPGLLGGGIVGGAFPSVLNPKADAGSTYADGLLTTSPTSPDTDMDGMDDYWEVFHGLNPILGDYATTGEGNLPIGSAAGTDASDYSVDKVAEAYLTVVASGSANAVFQTPAPERDNPFLNARLYSGNVTGYNYYAYPWLAGAPFADPDGDALINSEEAVNGVFGDKSKRYGTDPSPLWMTDPSNPNSLVARFYQRLNAAAFAVTYEGGDPAADTTLGGVAFTSGRTLFLGYEDAIPYAWKANGSVRDDRPGIDASVLPFEVNEGFDTDGDGFGDLTELTSTTILSGDPQTLRTPNRQQSAYFGGTGVLQSLVNAHFGPLALRTFTVECWIKPDATQDEGEIILIDRPWRFDENVASSAAQIRHNFQLGLRSAGGVCVPFVRYTGAGTAIDAAGSTVDEGTPKASPTVSSSAPVEADDWTHLAATYDGTRLALFVNGTEVSAQTCNLVPANGTISLSAAPTDEVRSYTFRQAPVIIGGTPADGWFANLSAVDTEGKAFTDFYTGLYRGFIDEVRIWNGARTAAQLKDNIRHIFSEAELLSNRLAAFTERFTGNGYYQDIATAELLALYTFNDMLAGTKTKPAEGEAAVAEDTPWETYPGEKTIGGADKPGSFLYRRSGLAKTPASDDVAQGMPTDATEVFTSYYAAVPEILRSSKYTETEYVPFAHNAVGHLPQMDVERQWPHLLASLTLRKGTPPYLGSPSGDFSHNKPTDSVYWTPYAAGTNVTSTVQFPNVKTAANPYGYRYEATVGFDARTYREYEAYTYRNSPDLIAYGDVFPKYDFSSWNNSPSTDPGAGDPETEATKPGGDWFDYSSGEGSDLNDKQNSNGGEWLENNVANGSTEDTDGDLMPNWWESYYGLDPEDPTGENGPHGDRDGDFLTNYAEYLAKSDPGKYSTLGNEVPDYQIPIWFRRGRPTFGLLYTDNDFMEDHWEASNRNERLTVDLHDAEADADGDGWSNWAEARANFRSGRHSTNPNAATSISQTGKVTREMPTPALRLTVDYFGDQNVYTNAVAGAKLLVHAYTQANGNSAPDAAFELPLAVSDGGEQSTVSQELGLWHNGTFSGYLDIGNITPGSLRIRYERYRSNETSQEGNSTSTATEAAYFDIFGDTLTDNDVAELYTEMPATYVDSEGQLAGSGVARVKAGSINYRTGHFTLDFSNTEDWEEQGFTYDIDDSGTLSNIVPYNRKEFLGTASYKYGVVPGKSNTFTMVSPKSGYLREGKNNFFVFADLNADGYWNDGEPAGIPDQHDVDIGFDIVGQPLHVALTEIAPPGSVRLDVRRIIDALKAESDSGTVDSADGSSLMNPSTGDPLDPAKFTGLKDGMKYWLVLTTYENIVGADPSINAEVVAFRKLYNVQKPYLTEDDIFAASASGLPGTAAENQLAMSYKAYLVPENVYNAGGSVPTWSDYNIAVVTNIFSRLDRANTKLRSPIGGAILHNTEVSFEWTSNVQVPTFTLTIQKIGDATGASVTPVTVYEDTVRGVAPAATDGGSGSETLYRYRYALPRGIGELRNGGTPELFGNGLYGYTVSLKPYNGSSAELTGTFRLQLRDSGDPTMVDGKSISYDAQDSFYVRTRVRYNGVLCKDEDFGNGRILIEAHTSASFNGAPVAAVSDVLRTDADDAEAAKLNPFVRMSRDIVTKRGETEVFWSTRFDAEIRGLPTKDPVYLVAYLDLNRNGRRDAWEPWGYATQGTSAVGGYYFDPQAVVPVNNGRDILAEFYIQDVDTDNDKLADSWEWLQSTRLGKDVSGDFSEWAENFVGTKGDHTAQDIWTIDVNGNRALTAYGAQLLGIAVTSEPDANGAISIDAIDGVEDGNGRYLFVGEAGKALGALDIQSDAALALLAKGYDVYSLAVESITFDGEAVTLTWKAVASKEGAEPEDITELFASAAYKGTVYAVYGSDTLAGLYELVDTIPLKDATARGTTKAIGLTASGKKPTFFKVRLFAAGDAPAETLAD